MKPKRTTEQIDFIAATTWDAADATATIPSYPVINHSVQWRALTSFRQWKSLSASQIACLLPCNQSVQWRALTSFRQWGRVYPRDRLVIIPDDPRAGRAHWAPSPSLHISTISASPPSVSASPLYLHLHSTLSLSASPPTLHLHRLCISTVSASPPSLHLHRLCMMTITKSTNYYVTLP